MDAASMPIRPAASLLQGCPQSRISRALFRGLSAGNRTGGAVVRKCNKPPEKVAWRGVSDRLASGESIACKGSRTALKVPAWPD